MRAAIVSLVMLVGCWSGCTSSPGPARWRSAPVQDALPNGAWLVAAMDFADDSPGQRASEDKARRDPSSARNKDGGCQIPTFHFAVAAYDRELLAVTRGGVHRQGMMSCLADMGRSRGSVVTNRVVHGQEALELRSDEGGFLVTASDAGMLVGATDAALFSRALAPEIAPATADPQLGPLIRQARARGDVWIAARLPAGRSFVDDALAAMRVQPRGRIVSIIGGIRFTAPQRVDIEIGLASADDARLVASGLEAWRLLLRTRVDADLGPLLDAVHVEAAGTVVRIAGSPSGLDWLKVLSGAMRSVAAFTSSD